MRKQYKVEVICQWCNKNFEVYIKKQLNNRGKFCSKSCWCASRPGNIRMSICHPERKHRSKGLCEECYQLAYNRSEESLSRKREASWKQMGIIFTVKEYNDMLFLQNGCCKICNKLPKSGSINLAVDHNHDTGKIRGLLCLYCNRNLIGQNSLETFYRASQYLEQDINKVDYYNYNESLI